MFLELAEYGVYQFSAKETETALKVDLNKTPSSHLNSKQTLFEDFY